MKRKLLILGIGIIVGFGSLSFSVSDTANAESSKQLEEKKKDVQKKRSGVQSEINSTKNKVDKINEEQAAVQSEIKKLDFAIADTNSKIREKEKQIEDAKKEIERLEKEIAVLKEQIKKRDALLKERVRSIQENGGPISYLEVLLGAQSFGDFINRVSAVTTFVDADRALLETHQKDKELLDKAEAEVQKQLAQLNKSKDELVAMRNKLNSQNAAKNKLLAQLNKQEEEMHEVLHDLEDEDAILAAQEKAMAKEIAFQKKQEEKRRKQAQAQAKASSGPVGATPPVTSGAFMNPTTGSLTSHFGQRWGAFHSGIDIGKGGRAGAVPIVASAEGTVIRANYDNSYGNVVMITHYINGQTMTTLYGHMESLSVSNGQRVEKGQVLGYMGSTGNSTGPHLHFEIHHGPWNGSRTNAVNPLKYVSY